MNVLRWIGKIVAVLSALTLGSLYVASRASPGLLEHLQVFGGEGGGRPVYGSPPGSEPSGANELSETKPGQSVLASSSKSAGGVITARDVETFQASNAAQAAQPAPSPSVFAAPAQAMMTSSKSGAIFTPQAPLVSKPAIVNSSFRGTWKSGESQHHDVAPYARLIRLRTPLVLSDGTVIQLSGEIALPSPSPGTSRAMMPRPTIIDASPQGIRPAVAPPAIDVQQFRLPPRYQPVPQYHPVSQGPDRQAPAQPNAAPARRPEIMPGSKSAPVF